jgi:hypothetical protein
VATLSTVPHLTRCDTVRVLLNYAVDTIVEQHRWTVRVLVWCGASLSWESGANDVFLPKHTITRSTLQAGRGTMTWSKCSKGFMSSLKMGQTVLAAGSTTQTTTPSPLLDMMQFRRAFVRESSPRKGGRRNNSNAGPVSFPTMLYVVDAPAIGTQIECRCRSATLENDERQYTGCVRRRVPSALVWFMLVCGCRSSPASWQRRLRTTHSGSH